MKRTYLLTALLATVLITAGCSERPTDSSQDQTAIRLDLNITSPEFVSQIATYRVIVTGPDMDSVVAPLTVIDGRYLEGVVEVPAGRNRRFAVQALDESGTVLYQGITITDVAAGVDIGETRGEGAAIVVALENACRREAGLDADEIDLARGNMRVGERTEDVPAG